MRKTVIGSMVVFGMLLAAPAAQAFDSDWRVKGGLFSIDGDSTAAVNAGIVYGVDFLGMLGAEFELNTSITDGEFDSGFGTVDYSALQAGAFGTITTPGPIYFKGKAGLAYNDVEIGSFSSNETAPSIGIGLGLFGFEIEYTRTEWEDLDVDMLSVSFGF